MNYTAEQVEVVAGIHEDVRFADEKNRDKLADKTSAMLRDYATLLRERESAKVVVTDEIAERVLNQYVKNCLSHLDEAPVSLRVEAMRAALEAVTPMLASARVPDEIREDDPRQFLGWSDVNVAYRYGWNQCRDAMLAAASKPEKE